MSRAYYAPWVLLIGCSLLALVSGCTKSETIVVFALVAKEDIPAGTKIENGDNDNLFKPGAKYEKGKEPSDILLFNDSLLLRGKVFKKNVTKGQVVKRDDIGNP